MAFLFVTERHEWIDLRRTQRRTKQAMNATALNKPATAANVKGSFAVTPNNNDAITRVRAKRTDQTQGSRQPA